MIPEEFAAKMKEIADRAGDTELNHCLADDLLCEVLKSLGYEQGVKVFEDLEKWYA